MMGINGGCGCGGTCRSDGGGRWKEGLEYFREEFNKRAHNSLAVVEAMNW